MKKTLLVIENDIELKEGRHDYVLDFMEQYKGEIIVMTGFGHKSEEEIKKNLIKATDIVVQTCFINGSDNQFYEMVAMLSKLPKPLNIHIALLGEDLEQYIINHLAPKELHALKHHTIYDIHCERAIDDGEVKLDFTSITDKYEKGLTKERVRKLYMEHYKATAPLRPTGRKILVLCCNAYGPAFKNLPIGKEVDELDCTKLESKKITVHGVWIMGNGEPIKLINDDRMSEYQITTKLSIEELLSEIEKTTPARISKLKPLSLEGLRSVLESDHEDDTPMAKANFICEQLKIPKRANRQTIYKLLSNNQ